MIFWKLRKRPFKWCVKIQNLVGALICHFSALDHGLLFMVLPNRQILLSLKYELWWHHLKGLLLSFQKIRKSLKLDQRNSSYGCWNTYTVYVHSIYTYMYVPLWDTWHWWSASKGVDHRTLHGGKSKHTQRQQYCVPTLVEVDQIIVQGLGAANITRGGGGQDTKGNRGQLVLWIQMVHSKPHFNNEVIKQLFL